MATVTKIPATVSRFTAAPITVKQKRKVAAYARVSTDHEDQLNSYEAQCDYYEHYIRANDDWEYAGLYSDEGISGTSTKRRNGFNQMVEDALAENRIRGLVYMAVCILVKCNRILHIHGFLCFFFLFIYYRQDASHRQFPHNSFSLL